MPDPTPEAVEALWRVLWPLTPDSLERMLADPGPLLTALAEAGVLEEERCCDRAWREMDDFGGTRIVICDGPCERSRVVSPWKRVSGDE